MNIKRFASLALALIMIFGILTGCKIKIKKRDSATDDGTGSASTSVEQTSSALAEDPDSKVDFGAMGRVITVGDDVYYLKHNSDTFADSGAMGYFAESRVATDMVRLKDGKEEVLFSVEASGEFVYADGVFFFNGNDGVFSVKADGTGRKLYGEGYLSGVTEDGKYVITSSSKIGICSISTEDEVRYVIAETTSPAIRVYKDKVYYSETPENYDAALKGAVTLYSVGVNGGEPVELYTTAADLYDYSIMGGYAEIGQLRFDDDYVYFSYGSLGGSGLFYQGGRVVRVRYDGTDGKVVSGAGELVDSQFELDGKGGVVTYDVISNADDDPSADLEYIDSKVYFYDRVNGKRMEILESDDYSAESGESFLKYVEVWNSKVYYFVHYAEHDAENDIGWRPAYIRTGSALYVKDLTTGSITEIYSIK